MDYVTTDPNGRWSGLGRVLQPDEIDGNFYELRSDLDEVIANPPAAVYPVSVTTTDGGSKLTFNMSDGSTIGPISLPLQGLQWRGSWAASTSYNAFDVFQEPLVGLYLVLQPFTSGTIFDDTIQVNNTAAMLQMFAYSDSLATLADVSITNLTDKQIIQFNATTQKWVNVNDLLADLFDVSLGTLADGDVLSWNLGAAKWENKPAVSASIATLTDVTITGLVDDQILQYQSSSGKWVNVSATSVGSATALNPRGSWAAGTVYAPNDVVRDGAGFFVCYRGVSGSTHPVADATHWVEVSIIDGTGLDAAFGFSGAAPTVPTLTASSSGGSLATGTVYVKITYTGAGGESAASAEASVVVTGPSGSVAVTSPGAESGATGYKVYAGSAAGAEVVQNSGTAIAIGTGYTLTALATAGAAAPTGNSAATGSILQRGTTGWAALPPGSSGQALLSAGSGATNSWGWPTLANLGDVSLTSLADKQSLRYDSASGKWLNKSDGYFTSLDIEASGTAGLVVNGTGAAPNVPAGWFGGLRTNGTAGAPTAVLSNDTLAGFIGGGWDGTVYSTAPGEGGCGFILQASENWTSTAHGTRAVFQVVKNGNIVPLQTFTIENDGGLISPESVTGGSQGPGTINVSGGYFVNGSAVSTTTTLAGDLDAVSSTPGSMLFRNPTVWQGLAPGTDGEVLTFSGTSNAPVWSAARWLKYVLAFSAPQTTPYSASQVVGHHCFATAVTIPANFGAYLELTSEAGGTANATGSTVVSVQKALAASPNTFSQVGTITFGAGSTTPVFASSGGATISFAQGDVLRLVMPSTPDATFAGFYATLVSYEGVVGAATPLTDLAPTQTANFSVGTYAIYPVDSTAGAITATLPVSPASGEQHTIKDESGAAATHAITIAGNGKNIDGASSLVIGSAYGWVRLVYTGTQWSQI
jgi:hypothetical protein